MVSNRTSRKKCRPRRSPLDGRALEPEFAGHPQEFDLALEIADEQIVLARRPALLPDLRQFAIDAAMDLKDRDPLGFGRVRGHGRADAQTVQSLLHGFGGIALGSDLADDIGKRAHHVVGISRLFGFAAGAHRLKFVGNGDQLKPDACRLQCRDAEFPGQRIERRATQQNFGDLRFTGPDDRNEQLKQQLAHVVARDEGLAILHRYDGHVFPGRADLR